MWRHLPWLMGVLTAPLLFGAVGPEGQAATGLLFGASLLLLASELRGPTSPAQWWWLALGAFLLLLPLIPLPVPLVQLISPRRVQLAQEFPVGGVLPAWLSLTLSPAGTLQRLWELALLICAFRLARHGASVPGFANALLLVVGLGLVLLATSDIWYRMDGQRALLGVKKTLWGKGAGTFANRNHFADWLYVAGLFCAGGVLRAWWPLRGARQHDTEQCPLAAGTSWLLAATIVFGTVLAVLSGSRGGIIALAAGLFAWVVLLARRSRDKRRFLLLGLVGLGGFVLLLLAGDSLFSRLAEMRVDLAGRYPKLSIWEQSLKLWTYFPAFGTGWGSFVSVFNHFKSTGGDSTFWHVENDYLQLLVETGLVGVTIAALLLCRWLHRPLTQAWGGRMPEPELVFGALAALAAFACHAFIEFVFQITGTAVLAAVLLGWLAGNAERIDRPAVVAPVSTPRWLGNLLGGGLIASVAVLQALGWWHWRQSTAAESARAASEAITTSLKYWPLATARRVALVRAQVRAVGGEPAATQRLLAAGFQRELTAALRLDPMHWELRLERAWLDTAFSTNRALIRNEVLEVVRLNPLQPAVPLRFAPYLINHDPDLAADLLRRARPVTAADLRTAYQVSWRLFARPALLWELTPDTVLGLRTLTEYALERRLFQVAVQAGEQLRGRMDSLALAEYFFLAQRPDLAAATIPQPPLKPGEKLLLARANEQLGQLAQAVKYAEMVWRESARAAEILTPAKVRGTPAAALAEWQARPENAALARELAEHQLGQPPPGRDLKRLRELAAKFPADLRLRWIVFRTEQDLGLEPEAARTAVHLAQAAGRR